MFERFAAQEMQVFLPHTKYIASFPGSLPQIQKNWAGNEGLLQFSQAQKSLAAWTLFHYGMAWGVK